MQNDIRQTAIRKIDVSLNKNKKNLSWPFILFRQSSHGSDMMILFKFPEFEDLNEQVNLRMNLHDD